jgi:serine/threonine-protein kinase
MRIGQTVGGYEIMEQLEASSEGVTYKVRNLLLQRLELLRVLPKTIQEDSERVTRFLREAQLHARINHPNIASFYHAAQLDGELVMTTELVEGTQLSKLRQSGPLPLQQAIRSICQVLSALEHAHSMGVVHRDVTPSNIILMPDEKVKLTGFGLAKATTDPQLTQPGTVVGSLNYISPEQIKGLTELDGRTDIYSLGVVLYETLTGRRPFHRTSQFELMSAHMNELPRAPSLVNSEVTAELSEIVLTAMAKNPLYRFQTAQEFRQKLEQLGGVAQPGLPPMAEPRSTVTLPKAGGTIAARERPQRWPSWRLWTAGLFMCVVVFLAVVALIKHF